MQSTEPTYPSFSLLLSQQSYPFRLPAYRASHLGRYHPYPRVRTPRELDLEDPSMRTIDTRYDGPRLDRLLPTIQEDDIDNAAVNLQEVASPKDERTLARRLDVSTLAGELALAIRHWLERLCVRRKESEVQFEMLV